MAIKGYFFNAVQSGGVYDRTYNAQDVTSYLDELVGNGVFPNPSTQLQVRQGSGMTVTVGAGQGWINGHKMINTADLNIELDESDVLLDRIDRIIFFVDWTTREMGIDVLKGNLATNPVGKALTRNGDRYEMCLAEIRVNHGASSISGSNIFDTRADSSLCGFVAGLIQQIDTTTLFNQYASAYAQQLAAMEDWEEGAEDAFDSWFSTLTSQLQVNAYVKRYQKIVNLTGNNNNLVITLDMTGYTYENADIIDVYLNGLLLTEGVDYTGSLDGSDYKVSFLNTIRKGAEVKVLVTKGKIGDPAMSGSGIRQLTIDNIISGTTSSSAEGEIQS